QMSAFSFPGEPEVTEGSFAGAKPNSVPAPAQPSQPRLPKPPPPRVIATAAAAPSNLEGAMPAEHGRPLPSRPAPPAAAQAAGNGGSEAAEWRQIYQEFVATKQQCGESIDGFTYEKFEQTLKKNRDALV